MSIKKIDEIDIPVWYKPGNGHMLRRSCLPWDHIGSEYSYIKNELNLIPEEFGVYKNMQDYKELSSKTHEELIQEIISLREEVLGYMKAGF